MSYSSNSAITCALRVSLHSTSVLEERNCRYQQTRSSVVLFHLPLFFLYECLSTSTEPLSLFVCTSIHFYWAPVSLRMSVFLILYLAFTTLSSLHTAVWWHLPVYVTNCLLNLMWWLLQRLLNWLYYLYHNMSSQVACYSTAYSPTSAFLGRHLHPLLSYDTSLYICTTFASNFFMHE